MKLTGHARRTFFLLFSAIMLLATLAGCASAPADPSMGAATDTSTATTTSEPPKEDITLTIGIRTNPTVETYDNNGFTLWLEEQTGYELEFVSFAFDNDDANTQLATMMAGNERLPDILWGFPGVTKAMMFEFGDDGYFIDLAPYFANSTYFNERYKQLDENQQKNLLALGTNPANGALYGAPSLTTAVADSFNHMYINQEWLKAVGLGMPTNPDELYEVLVAFRDKDPNRNGKKDEIPLIGSDLPLYRADVVSWLLSNWVYQVNLGNEVHFFNADDGKIYSPYTTEEYREGLRYVRKLVDEGLLSPLTFTIAQTAELKGIMTPADKVPIVGAISMHPALHVDATEEGDYQAWRQYTGLPPFNYAPLFSNTYSYSTFITTDCENPDAAFKLIDRMYGLDATMRMRYGVYNVDWVDAPAGATNIFGEPATFKALNEGLWGAQNNSVWNLTSCFIGDLYQSYSDVYEDDGTLSAHSMRIMYDLVDAYYELAAKNNPKELVLDRVYSAEEQKEYTDKNFADIRLYIKTSRAEFATGALNLDKDWDTYLKNLEDMGLGRYIEMTQAAYDRVK